jgi:large subunit ribosomal protein L10
MNKEQKKEVVAELTDQLKGAEAVFAIDYRGISVPQAAELRTGLREAGTSFRVVKNRLTLLAADAAGTDEIKEHLSGPTALALVDEGDVALAAKTISRLGGEWELLDYKGGVMNGEVLDPDSFKTIARLPGREQLNAQFAGIVASPLTGLIRGLGSMVQGLASQLQQIADQGLVSGEAPEAPKDEKSEGDPDPEESSEESSGEELPDEAAEEGTEVVEQTGEGDAEPGEAQEDAAEGGDEGATQETSEADSEEKKEEGE